MVKGFFCAVANKLILTIKAGRKKRAVWIGKIAERSGAILSASFFFFLLGVAGGRYSDLKLLTLCVILLENAKTALEGLARH